MRESEPQKDTRGVLLGSRLGGGGWRQGAGRSAPSPVQSWGGLLSPPHKVLASSPPSNPPRISLSRWLSVSWPSVEALPEPTLRLPFPGVGGS